MISQPLSQALAMEAIHFDVVIQSQADFDTLLKSKDFNRNILIDSEVNFTFAAFSSLNGSWVSKGKILCFSDRGSITLDFQGDISKNIYIFTGYRVISFNGSSCVIANILNKTTSNSETDISLFYSCSPVWGVKCRVSHQTQSHGYAQCFVSCSDLINCQAEIVEDPTPGGKLGFYSCKRLSDCTVRGMTINTIDGAIGFSNCSGLALNCTSTLSTSGFINGFINCTSEIPKGLKVTCLGEFTYG